jgi:vacuolar-type H+-ATPase subunit H
MTEDKKTPEEILEAAKAEAEKIINDAQEKAEKNAESDVKKIIDKAKADAKAEAEKIIQKAEATKRGEAQKIVDAAEKRAKSIIEKAQAGNEKFEAIPKFRKEMILRVAQGAGAFRENTAIAVAKRIIAVADQVINTLKEVD